MRYVRSVALQYGQILNIMVDGDSVRIEEILPPCIPSGRLHEPYVADEAVARRKEWSDTFAKMLAEEMV